MTTGWESQAEDLAADLRARCGLTICCVPPSVIATKLRFKIKIKKLEDGLDGYHLEGTGRLVVAKGSYAPRQEASIAHELAEAHLPEPLPKEFHERFCERVAAALMLPPKQYVDSLHKHHWDIAYLRREVWWWCSWEVLVRRASDLLSGVASAAWTDGLLKWRSPDKTPTLAELHAIGRTRRKGRGSARVDGFYATAWSLAPKGALFRAVSICMPLRKLSK